MKKLEIPVKFLEGDTCYTIKQIKPEINCPICEGKGTIKYNNKDMKCPECMGKGKFISDKQVNVVCDEEYTITQTKISINSEKNISIKYKIRCNFSTLNRAEENIFATREEAQIKCDILNNDKLVPIKSDPNSGCKNLTQKINIEVKEENNRLSKIKESPIPLSFKDKVQLLLYKLEFLIDEALENNNQSKFNLYSGRYNKIKNKYNELIEK